MPDPSATHHRHDRPPTSVHRRDFLRLRTRSSVADRAGAAGGLTPAMKAVRRAAMRRLDKIPSSPLQKSVPTPPRAAVIALNRLAFGPRPGDLDAFDALAGTDPQRLQLFLDQQLDPASIDDSAFEARLAAAGFTTLDKSLLQLWQDHVVADPEWEERMRPFFETELVTFMRAVYSRKQLFEVLAEFWHNHFSVYAYEFSIGPVWVQSDRDAIRANVLGNFRTMLGTVATSTAMLYYLDNRFNSLDGPNENYARELIELHCMGADAYLGSIPQASVPLDGNGIPTGYVDEDVTAAARCLTGWTVRDRPWDDDFGDTGEFFYYDPDHDHAAKSLLGMNLPANQAAMKDGEDLLDRLATHPATARFLANKLCRRLVGDTPPQAVIDAAAATFAAQASAPDQLLQVVRTIVLHPAFLATWGDKIKRPFEQVTSAMRAGEANWDFSLDDEDTGELDYRYYHTGHPLFQWHPPNGYPDFKGAWKTTSPLVLTWKVTNWLVDVRDANDNLRLDLLGATPPGVRSANALADFWIDRILGYPIEPREREEIVEFMAQGFNPAFDLPLDSDDHTQDRLRSMVGLIFMSPAFLWR